MEATVLTKVVLPIALAIIMLGMGLSLTAADFGRVLKAPKAFAVGVLCQMLLLPLVGFAVAKAFGLSPELAVGLMLLALCPGGTTSNMFAFLARGDVALSISLTAVVSLITPFTIPIVGALAIEHFMGEAKEVALPLGETIVTLIAITVVPVGIGMLVRKKWPRLAVRTEAPLKWFSIAFLALIIAGVLKQNWGSLPAFFATAGTATFVLNVTTMALGFLAARGLRLRRDQAITIGIEVGIQNGTAALLLTLTILANPTMAIPPAVYSLLMFATGGVIAYLGQRTAPAEAAAPVRGAISPST